jgi:U3 small nucleolar RNA-associated protein 23
MRSRIIVVARVSRPEPPSPQPPRLSSPAVSGAAPENMRVKRARKVRKYLRYYRSAHGFREPYKVIVDGNFIAACEKLKLGKAKDAVAKYLVSSPRDVKVFTTRCVQDELRNMGPEYKGASMQTKELNLVGGGPAPGEATASASIVDACGVSNEERFVVCTQDEDLKEKLRKCKGAVPIVFAHTSGLQMEPPPDATAAGLTSQKEQVQGLSEKEIRALGVEEKDIRDVYRVKTSVKFKKKSGGKNPLSCLKKKKKEPAVVAQPSGEKKKRPRRKKHNSEGATN